MKMPGRVRATTVIAAGAVAALIAGGSYALAAGGGTIHACAKKSSGALRIARRCRNGERSVSWNVQGPRGQQGIQGPKGDPGPSNAYSSFENASVSLPNALGTVAKLSIPAAGDYAINAKVVLHDGGSSGLVQCQLVAAGTNLDQSETALAGGDYETAALQAAVQLSAAGEVDLQCDGFGLNTDASLAKITAIQVGSLTNSASA